MSAVRCPRCADRGRVELTPDGRPYCLVCGWKGEAELEVPGSAFSEAEARRVTEEVKADAAALWAKLLRLYEGGAHTALGYASWAAYCAAEFDMGKSRSYQVLNAARVVEALPESTNGGMAPPSERVARELVPLRDEPEQLVDAWSETVERHGPEPTAAQAREVVSSKRERCERPEAATYGRPSLEERLEAVRDALFRVEQRLDLLEQALDGPLTPQLAEQAERYRRAARQIAERLAELTSASGDSRGRGR